MSAFDIESEFKRFEREISSIPQPSASNAAGVSVNRPAVTSVSAFVPRQLQARGVVPPTRPAAPPQSSLQTSTQSTTVKKEPTNEPAPIATIEAKPVRYGGSMTNTSSAKSSIKQQPAATQASKFMPVTGSVSAASASRNTEAGSKITVTTGGKQAPTSSASTIPLPANAPATMRAQLEEQKLSASGAPPAKKAALAGHSGDKPNSGKGAKKPEKSIEETITIRRAGGSCWVDNTMIEWDANDHRVFCGDLGNEVTDETLTKVFSQYPTFLKAKVIRDKRTSKTKGFGFLSFKSAEDAVKAMKEWNGRYVGNRPIKLRKSEWSDRNLVVSKKKEKERRLLGLA